VKELNAAGAAPTAAPVVVAAAEVAEPVVEDEGTVTVGLDTVTELVIPEEPEEPDALPEIEREESDRLNVGEETGADADDAEAPD